MTGDSSTTPTEEQERLWQNFFYRDGTPERAAALLTRFVGEVVPRLAAAEEGGPTLANMAVFFARVAEGRPAVLRAYEGVARTVAVEAAPVVLRLLAHAGDAETAEFLRAFAAEPRNAAVAGLVEGLLRRGLGPAAEIEATAREAVTGPQHLDLRWMEFMATGDTRKVDEIVAVLAWPDRLRGHLEALLRPRSGLRALFGGNTKSAAIMRALEPLGFRFDPATHTIRNLEDVDLLAVSSAGRSDGARFQALLNALPAALPPEQVLAAATKASAVWSLIANGGEHDPVLAACEAALKRASGAGRLSLLEVVARVYEQRDVAAAALRAWTELRALAPEYAGVDERIEALTLEQQFAAIVAVADDGARALTPGECEAAARACAEQLARTLAYHVRMSHQWLEEPVDDQHELRSEWRGQHAGSDRTRMLRAFWIRARDEGLADEWIRIGDDCWIVGLGIPMKLTPDFGAREMVAGDPITRNDRFAALLRTQAPDRGAARPGMAAIELVYETADVGDLWRPGVVGPVRVVLTIDAATHWLARAQVNSLAGASRGFEQVLRYVAPARPFTIEAPAGAVEVKEGTRTQRGDRGG